MSIGENIKAMRKAAKLTQRQVADRLGMTESAVGQFEKPDANPQGDTLMKLAWAIGCSVQSFFDGGVPGAEETPFPVLERRAQILGMQIIYGDETFLRYPDGLQVPVTHTDLHNLNEGLDFYMLAETQKIRKQYEATKKQV